MGTEFDPTTGELYTIRASDILMSINLFTGEATQIGVLDGISTVNLAAPHAPVPEPGTFLLLGIGLAGLGFFIKKKAL